MPAAGEAPRPSAIVASLRCLQRLRDGIGVLVTVLGGLSGGLFLLLSFYITADASSRYFFGVSTRVSDEISGYALGVGATWAFAYALKMGGHVTLAILYDYYPRRLQIVLDYLSLALLAVAAFAVSVLTWQLALQSKEMGATHMGILSTPLAIPQGMLAFGFTLLAVQALVMLLGQIADSVLGVAPAAAATAAR
jgi:TRAP-type C4-dicarboxylate transport system permease small subunit